MSLGSIHVAESTSLAELLSCTSDFAARENLDGKWALAKVKSQFYQWVALLPLDKNGHTVSQCSPLHPLMGIFVLPNMQPFDKE